MLQKLGWGEGGPSSGGVREKGCCGGGADQIRVYFKMKLEPIFRSWELTARNFLPDPGGCGPWLCIPRHLGFQTINFSYANYAEIREILKRSPEDKKRPVVSV